MSLFVAALLPIVGAAAPPTVGEGAGFTLSTPEGKHIRLSL
jgi:hypothetical protein